MKNTIYINNEQSDIEIDSDIKSVIKRCVNGTLKEEKIDKSVEVSVLFCDEDTIKRLCGLK